MKHLFEKFTRGLSTSIENIGNLCFEIVIANSSKVAFRERVYCYELYHQLRNTLNAFPLFIYGEPDKGSHPDFKAIGRKSPDFIIHEPGNHGSNLAVLEVKSHLSSTKRFNKDIDTVCKFVRDDKIDYKWGLLLIVGGNDFKKRFLRKFDDDISSDEQIILLWHKAAKTKPIQIRGPETSLFDKKLV
ncbi:MAG: hypothetical protein P1Q69_10920 [Candidatus Thorarchaeota archaeon]|nr:hypothetical protein [Candidatus Thorarchaeota archaeon]